jgi:hypothetical protein
MLANFQTVHVHTEASIRSLMQPVWVLGKSVNTLINSHNDGSQKHHRTVAMPVAAAVLFTSTDCPCLGLMPSTAGQLLAT